MNRFITLLVLALCVFAFVSSVDARSTGKMQRIKEASEDKFFFDTVENFINSVLGKKKKAEELGSAADDANASSSSSAATTTPSDSTVSDESNEDSSDTVSEETSGDPNASVTVAEGEGESSAEDSDTTNAAPQDCGIGIRYSWRKLKNDPSKVHLLKNYLKAVRKLYENGGFMDMAKNHYKARNYAHGSNAFLPWHRAMLLKYEELLRAACPECGCVTIPYWDWIGDAGTLAEDVFCDGELCAGLLQDGPIKGGAFEGFELDGKKVFRKAPRNNRLSVGSQLGINAIIKEDLYGTPRWEGAPGFASKLEGVHGWPHCSVGDCSEMGRGEDMGPTMGSHYSPSDPIFYSHHAFIDYLWAIWQDCHDFDLISRENLSNFMNAFRGSWTYKYDTENEEEMITLDSKIAPWNELTYGEVMDLVDISSTYGPSHRQEASAYPSPQSVNCHFHWFSHLIRAKEESSGAAFIEMQSKLAVAKKAYAKINRVGARKLERDEAAYEKVYKATKSVELAELALISQECSGEDALGQLPKSWTHMNNFKCDKFKHGCMGFCDYLGFPTDKDEKVDSRKDTPKNPPSLLQMN